MITVTDSVLKELTASIVATSDPVSVYLFGSYARGNPRPDSDLDLLVVVDGRFNEGRSRLVAINRLRRELTRFRIAKDILVYTSDELAKWRNSRNHVIARCLREGRQLYARH
jgi:predicted nucleotidyltransferase